MILQMTDCRVCVRLVHLFWSSFGSWKKQIYAPLITEGDNTSFPSSILHNETMVKHQCHVNETRITLSNPRHSTTVCDIYIYINTTFVGKNCDKLELVSKSNSYIQWMSTLRFSFVIKYWILPKTNVVQ